MTRAPSRTRSLLQLVRLQLQWNLRAPQGLVYHVFMSGVVLYLLAHLGGTPAYLGVLVPGVMALVTTSRALQGVAVTVSYMRRYGEWRTMRASPIPTWLFLAGFVLSSMVITLVVVAAVLCLAYLLLGYTYSGNYLLLAAYTAGGFVAFAALGLVVTYLISSPQAVTSIINVLFFVMMISSNALTVTDAPWLEAVSVVSPMTAFVRLLRDESHGAGLAPAWWLSVATLAAWCAVASMLAIRLARARVEEA